jgi:TonB family protein
VHLLAFSIAFVWAFVMPHTPLKPPYCTVNLVSMKDLGTDSLEPKGKPKTAQEAVVSENVATSGKTSRKSEQVAPVKRLAIDEEVRKPEAQIKKIEPKEVPIAAEKPQSLEAIEKNLDKLIAKPKVIPHTSLATAEQAVPQPEVPAHQAPAKNQPGSEKVTHGTPSGAVEGGARGTAQGSAYGSPEGSTATNQLVNMYAFQVTQKIQSEWRLVNEQGINGLKAVVEVQIKKTGEIVSIRVMAKSGNELFDDAAVRAVNRAAPLPPVPEAIAQSSTKLILTFLPGHVS